MKNFCLACYNLNTQKSWCLGHCSVLGIDKYKPYHNCTKFSPIDSERFPDMIEWFKRYGELMLERARLLEDYQSSSQGKEK